MQYGLLMSQAAQHDKNFVLPDVDMRAIIDQGCIYSADSHLVERCCLIKQAAKQNSETWKKHSTQKKLINGSRLQLYLRQSCFLSPVSPISEITTVL